MRALLRPLPSLRSTVGPVHVRTVGHLRTVRYTSARYSVPGAFIGRRVEVRTEGSDLMVSHGQAEIARHRLIGPGEISLSDAH